MDQQKKNKNWRKFIQLIMMTNPPKLLILIALTLSLSSTIISLLVPLFTKDLINDFNISLINKSTIIILITIILLQAISSGFSIYLLNKIGETVVANVRRKLFKKLIILPLSYFDENPSGESVSRMTNDTTIIKTLISDHLVSFISGIISIVGATVVLFLLDWKMTLTMFIAIPIAAAIIIPLNLKMFKISKALQASTASLTSLLTQIFSEMRLVKSSNSEKKEIKNSEENIQSLWKFGLKEAKIYSLVGPTINLVMMVLLVVLLGYGGIRVSSGALTAGALVAFIMYLFQIIVPMAQIADFATKFQKASGATERIIDLLNTDAEPDGTLPAPLANKSLSIENISYHYTNKQPVLKNISFTIEENEVTAIVGPSGSGKTTLFSLFERFYLPQSGEIKLGDDNIAHFSLVSWREQIGYVSQESPLISGTIRDNIVYGLQKDISDAAIENVIKMAYAEQFISKLEKGIYTEVGERGMKLSGGQRQRIAIARAFLRNPKILMLDEATSSLDSQSEKIVQQALDHLMKGRTTIIIAHRLSTVVHANKIVFLDAGEVTGIGTHSELFEQHPMYREFATQQLQNKKIGT